MFGNDTRTSLSEKLIKRGDEQHPGEDRNQTLFALRKTIQCNPSSWDAYLQLAIYFHATQALKKAIPCYHKVLSFKKGHFDALFFLGLAYQDDGKPELAVDAYEKAMEAQPLSTAVQINLGTAHQMIGHHAKAIRCYENALCRSPDNPTLYMNMGTAQTSLGQHDKAVRCYEKAVALKPDYEKAICYLYRQYQKHCEWKKAQPLDVRLDALTRASLNRGERPEETPFLNISRHADPALNRAVAHAWSHQLEIGRSSDAPVYSHDTRSLAEGIIRIGYLSNTFCDHPGGQLLHDLFGLHDRSRFKVFGYSLGPDDDSRYRRDIRAGCDVFRDVRDVDGETIAGRIYKDRIDIYIDLMGHITDSRMDVARCRPAPVQVRYLGMAGTTGARFFDYIVTDPVVTPLDQASFYSERFVHLPYTYQINSQKFPDGSTTYSRTDFGLSDFEFVFGSFNTSYKIDSVLFGTWMKILKRVPKSALWLMGGSEILETNLVREVKNAGVDPRRVVFSEKLPKAHHLARLPLVDLILDTRIVNGAASTSDALWMGVPVLTLQGAHFASRMSASLLHAVKMESLVTQNLVAYENLAVSLATHGRRLNEARSALAAGRFCTPLFDTALSVRLLEHAYLEMWRRHARGVHPDHIQVGESTPMLQKPDGVNDGDKRA